VRVARHVSKNAVAAILLLAVAFDGTVAAGSEELGSSIDEPANAGVCPVQAHSHEASCTVLQLRRGGKGPFAGKHATHYGGVITGWWVTSGWASRATSAVHLRLRVFDGFTPVPGLQTSNERLPLRKPGKHKFSTRLPIKGGQQVGLEVAVKGRRGASAPIARSVQNVGETLQWAPPLGSRHRRPTDRMPSTRLMLLGRLEPDLDQDGWGDSSQDACPFDRRRHSACLPDQTKPHIRLTYAPRQDFVARRKLFLKVRSNERGSVSAGGLFFVRRDAVGLLDSRIWLEAGESGVLPVYLNDYSVHAAKRAIAKGLNPYVEVSFEATDASGNKVRRHFRVRWKKG